MVTYTAQHKAATKPAPQKLKRTVVNDVTPKLTLSESIHDDVKGLFEKYKIAVPSTTRLIISLIACTCVGMGIGFIGSILVETLVVSAMMFTGSLFLGVALYFIGVLATLYAAWKAGGIVGNFIMSGDIDRSYQKYSTAVRSFFSFGNREVTS